jgi:hypothetical protein
LIRGRAMAWLCTMNDLQERRGLGRGCPGLFGWEAIAQGANTHINTREYCLGNDILICFLSTGRHEKISKFA